MPRPEAISAAPEQGPGGLVPGGPMQNDGIFGSVISVDATTIAISAANPWGPPKKTTFNVSATTTITADGAAVSLASLTTGTLVSIQTSSTDATTATSITAIDKRVGGTVTAIDTTANTIAIADRSGAATTYTLNAAVTVTLAGVASTLAAVTTSTHVQLKLSAIDGTVLSIETDPQENLVVPPPPNGMPTQPSGVGGVVVSVDSTANTITLKNEDAIQTTYTLAATGTVTLDGVASTLSAIVAGDLTQLQLSADGTTVTSVAALSPQTNPGNPGDGGPVMPLGVGGPIVSVDATANTITLNTPGGTPTTYTLSATATITLNDATNALSALAAGDLAWLQLSADGTTVTSIHATAMPNPGGPDQPPVQTPPTMPPPVGGSVTAVDSTGDTITIQDGDRSTTYALGASTVVTLNGAAQHARGDRRRRSRPTDARQRWNDGHHHCSHVDERSQRPASPATANDAAASSTAAPRRSGRERQRRRRHDHHSKRDGAFDHLHNRRRRHDHPRRRRQHALGDRRRRSGHADALRRWNDRYRRRGPHNAASSWSGHVMMLHRLSCTLARYSGRELG